MNTSKIGTNERNGRTEATSKGASYLDRDETPDHNDFNGTRIAMRLAIQQSIENIHCTKSIGRTPIDHLCSFPVDCQSLATFP